MVSRPGRGRLTDARRILSIQALVVGVVDPAERTAAAAYTNTARYVTRPLGTLCAAPLAQASLGAPFVVAGAVKSAYDLGFFAAFRRVDLS
jgi:hypothetical protein